MSAPLGKNKQPIPAAGDGCEAVLRRSLDVDQVVERIFALVFGTGGAGVAVTAVGGYGRRQLFPHSDVDLLILFESQAAALAFRDSLAVFLGKLWDCGLRASHSVRTPAECTSLSQDNAELHISLLDARHLAGDSTLWQRLLDGLARFYLRERESLMRALARLARSRHSRYGDTIYHLEPNVKDAPGGLRDYQLYCWLARLARYSPGPLASLEDFLPTDKRAGLIEARRFLFELRCGLHWFHERDNNILTFEYQERAAAGAGLNAPAPRHVAAWMREYFRHARLVHLLAARALEETASSPHSPFALFRNRQSRLSNADFAVTRGRLFLKRPQALESEPGLLLRLFEFMARHGVLAAPETLRRAARAVPAFRLHLDRAHRFELPLWPSLAAILRLPQAYQALTAMRETGLWTALFPEYELIDCLVVRDFYHHYTVDEHCFRAVKTLQELGQVQEPLTARFAELMQETERPELLLFALLFHDADKGVDEADHVGAGVALAEKAMARLQMEEQDRQEVRFLIRHHLEMSATMTGRDLADPATALQFAERVSTLERLRTLTLLTYADTAAVNPDALSPWRKELLWHLYLITHNLLTGEMEAERISEAAPALAQAIGANEEERQALAGFLQGLPTRYLRTRTPQQIAEHFRLQQTCLRKPAAVSLTRRGSLYELVAVAADRPLLFASLAGAVSSFAMNIVKAEGFSNSEGMVLDTLLFADPGRSLELNPGEADRLRSTLELVLLGKVDAQDLLRKRPPPASCRRLRVPRQISYDNQVSANNT
ncbi:MAG: HD domain-containing protein, partial [Acidobacteria bacterium]|nr:HD domain-containing protein [Acidobacteriota bacterium]